MFDFTMNKICTMRGRYHDCLLRDLAVSQTRLKLSVNEPEPRVEVTRCLSRRKCDVLSSTPTPTLPLHAIPALLQRFCFCVIDLKQQNLSTQNKQCV